MVKEALVELKEAPNDPDLDSAGNGTTDENTTWLFAMLLLGALRMWLYVMIFWVGVLVHAGTLLLYYSSEYGY